MKRDSGTKDRDERSRGTENLMTVASAKIKSTEPIRIGKQTARRNLNWSWSGSGTPSERLVCVSWPIGFSHLEMWTPKRNMCHREIHYQTVPGVLRLLSRYDVHDIMSIGLSRRAGLIKLKKGKRNFQQKWKSRVMRIKASEVLSMRRAQRKGKLKCAKHKLS
jgi:hypothetical protein